MDRETPQGGAACAEGATMAAPKADRGSEPRERAGFPRRGKPAYFRSPLARKPPARAP